MKAIQNLILVATIFAVPALFAVAPGAVPPGMEMPAPTSAGGPPGTPPASSTPAGSSMPGGLAMSADKSLTYPGEPPATADAPPLKEQLAQSPQERLSLPLGPGGTPSNPQPAPPGFQPLSPGGEGSFPRAAISSPSLGVPSRAERILHETELRVTLRHYEKTLSEISELGLKLLQQKERVRSGELPAQPPETTTLEAKLKVLQNWRLQIEDRIRKLQDQSRQSGLAEQQATAGEVERVRFRQAEAKLAQLTKGHAEGFVSDQELTEAKFLVELRAAELKGDPVALAECRVRHAEHTLEIAMKLYEAKAASKESLDEAKSTLAVRKAELKRSKDTAAQGNRLPGPGGSPGIPGTDARQAATQPPPGALGMPGGAPTESRDSLGVMLGSGGSVAGEEANAHGFPVPRGEVVVGKDESALFVHDGKEVHYIVSHLGEFAVSDASTHEPKTSVWRDDRNITLKNGRTFGFTRTSSDNLHFLVNGTEYDLRAGRAFSLSNDGKIKQLRVQPSMELMRECQQRIRLATLAPADAKSP